MDVVEFYSVSGIAVRFLVFALNADAVEKARHWSIPLWWV